MYLRDDTFLSLCHQNSVCTPSPQVNQATILGQSPESSTLIGALPFPTLPTYGYKFIHGNELNKNFVRVLIAQKKLYAYVVEITKVYDSVYKSKRD